MHNQNNNASIWDLETLKREIKEYNLEFFSKYLKKYSVLNNDIEFIKDELAFVQKEIDESFNDGLNKQYFQHIKSVILKYCKINDIAIAPNTVSNLKSMTNNHIQKVLESLIDVLNKNSYGEIVIRQEINLDTVKNELKFELESYNLSPEFAILVLEGLVSYCKFYPNRFNLKDDWNLDHSDSIAENLEWFNDMNINLIAVIQEIINSYSILVNKPSEQGALNYTKTKLEYFADILTKDLNESFIEFIYKNYNVLINENTSVHEFAKKQNFEAKALEIFKIQKEVSINWNETLKINIDILNKKYFTTEIKSIDFFTDLSGISFHSFRTAKPFKMLDHSVNCCLDPFDNSSYYNFSISTVNSLIQGYIDYFLLNKYREDLSSVTKNEKIIDTYPQKLYAKTELENQNILLQNIEKPVWQSLIKLELHNKLFEIEEKIPAKIANWNQRIKLIECAAFCQLLFDRKYFVQGSTNQKSVNSFSLSRYGTDITNQLKSAKKVGRKVHKEKLKKYFI